MKILSDTFNQINLNFKFIFKNVSFIYITLFIQLILILIPIFFAPLWASSPIFFEISVITISALTYGNLTYSIRNSTLYKNYYLNVQRKDVIYLASLITILTFSFLISFFQLILLFIFENILLYDWSFVESSQILELKNIDFFTFFYCIFWISLITFAISFSVRNWIKTEKNYYVMILIILLLCLVFGGTFNDYFIGNKIDENGNTIPNFYPVLFPKDIYWVSVFFPYYAPGQIISSSFEFSLNTYSKYDTVIIHWFSGQFRWNILLLMPPIWFTLLGFGGLIF